MNGRHGWVMMQQSEYAGFCTRVRRRQGMLQRCAALCILPSPLFKCIQVRTNSTDRSDDIIGAGTALGCWVAAAVMLLAMSTHACSYVRPAPPSTWRVAAVLAGRGGAGIGSFGQRGIRGSLPSSRVVACGHSPSRVGYLHPADEWVFICSLPR
jgi:hypothetical protein